MDLGTKGSGQTPYSRFGDGRLTLKGAVREILATEMLETLGVETSRTFSVIETGEALHRGDEPSPTRSAVLVRLNHGHIRIGSFQRLAALGETEHLKRLTAYALQHYYGEEDGPDAGARLVRHVVRQTARMAASFMAAGFVHGVLNSDNINITGESFDYGPWRWTPSFDPNFTAAYFDEQGLYAFGRQAEAIHWDVVQLANSLLDIAEREALVAAIDGFAPAYREALVLAVLWRLGVVPRSDAENIRVVTALESALFSSGVELDRFYFDWAGGKLRRPDTQGLYANPSFAELAGALTDFVPRQDFQHSYWAGHAPCSMHIDEVEAIWAPIAGQDDWSRVYDKVAAIRAMGAALRGEGQ
jgi:uncharacterized protein YdiU (UPF0061 family)